MDRTPPTPDPSDHQGPSSYEGWDPTPDPVGEIDIPGATGSGATSAPGSGIAFIPGNPATAPGAPDANRGTAPDASRSAASDDEVTALRERLAFYESFDSLIRDNIDRAGALMREVATRQVDAEARLRTTTKDFQRRQIEERSGYRKIFGSMLDEVATIQQQIERLAGRVSDALDDLELQLPAAGELSAMERGQAPGMTGLAAATIPPAGLPSGASSAAWVTHDDGLPAATGKHATTPTHPPVDAAEPDPAADDAAGTDEDTAPESSEPFATDDMDIVGEATGQVDPDVVADVLTEFTDGDPAVAESPEDVPTGTVQPSDLSDLPEEFGLDNPGAPGAAGVVDEPYVEQSATPDEIGYSEPPATGGDPEGDPLATGDAVEGYYVDSAPAIDRLLDEAAGGTPLQAAAPTEITEVDGGFDESPADGGDPASSHDADTTGTDGATASDAPSDSPTVPEPAAPYGSDAPAETAIGSGPASTGGMDAVQGGGPAGAGEPAAPRRSEPEAPRPVYGSVSPASRAESPRVPTQAAGETGASMAQDTIVLVHGVPRATTALSLKRYLEGLESVSAVEPREYAEGVLRLQVTGERAIRIADLSAWPDGSGLQEIQVREDLVEIRLPG